MTWTPNRIKLISHGRYDEAPASADVWPGMVLQNNAALAVAPLAVVGGKPQLMVAIEDAMQGGDATQKIASGNIVPFTRPISGDLLLMLLQNGQNVASNVPLMSAGDGTLIAATGTTGNTLVEIVAPSSNVTNTTVETTFSNGSYVLAANALAVGDTLHIRAKATCVAVAAAATQKVRLLVGTTALADSGAQSLIADDVVIIDIILTIRTIGASGTFIADGTVTYSVAGSFTEAPFTIASTVINTTTTETFAVKATASAAATGNQIRLDEFSIFQAKLGGPNVLVYSQEAINNSGGAGSSPMSTANSSTAAFIRCLVP